VTRRLRLVFAGTPEFAVPSLAACRASAFDVCAVYTQPDRPAGRGRGLRASPVKEAALAAGLEVVQPQTLGTVEARRHLRALRPDLMVVVAYGLILPPRVLAIASLGCWNVHASLLPRWRGAAPIQRAILAGDDETGVAVMQMEAGLDTGPLLAERRTPIAGDDTGGSLHDRLALLGADLLGEVLAVTGRGEPPAARPQAEAGVTYAAKLDKAEARLAWRQPAAALARRVRAFDPWPVAEADLGGERLRVWRARAAGPASPGAAPGTLVAAGPDGIDVACGEGVLRVLELQRAGGRRIAAGDWLNAHPHLRTRA
jgi:methionyl-tRNA formyltransferase